MDFAGALSDMHGFGFNERSQLDAQCFFGHQINRTAEQVFKLEQHAEIAL